MLKKIILTNRDQAIVLKFLLSLFAKKYNKKFVAKNKPFIIIKKNKTLFSNFKN